MSLTWVHSGGQLAPQPLSISRILVIAEFSVKVLLCYLIRQIMWCNTTENWVYLPQAQFLLCTDTEVGHSIQERITLEQQKLQCGMITEHSIPHLHIWMLCLICYWEQQYELILLINRYYVDFSNIWHCGHYYNYCCSTGNNCLKHVIYYLHSALCYHCVFMDGQMPYISH